jgi:hypothetical protein
MRRLTQIFDFELGLTVPDTLSRRRNPGVFVHGEYTLQVIPLTRYPLQVFSEAESYGINQSSVLSHLETKMILSDDPWGADDLEVSCNKRRFEVTGTERPELLQDTHESWCQLTERELYVDTDFPCPVLFGHKGMHRLVERAPEFIQPADIHRQSCCVFVSAKLDNHILTLPKSLEDVES